MKAYWRARLRCDHPTPRMNNSIWFTPEDCYEAAFLWWFYPMVISLALLLASCACRFLARSAGRIATPPPARGPAI